MKWINNSRKLLITLLILQLAVGSTQFAANQITVAKASASELYVEVEYTIQVRDGGLLVTKAFTTLRNDGTEPIPSLRIGFSKDFEPNLDDIVAYEAQELNVRRESVEGNVSWVEIDFIDAVKSEQTISLSIYFVYSGLITYDLLNLSTYTAVFPTYPVLPFDVARCEVTIELPVGTIAQASSLSGLLNEVNIPLKSYTNQAGFVNFTGDIRILECSRASSEILLDSWGRLHSSESYHIRNIGLISVPNIVFILPPDVEELMAYDSGGQLDITTQDLDSGKEARIHLRYPIRGVEGTVTHHEACAFTLSYKADSHAYISLTDTWAQYRLNIKIPTYLNLSIKNLAMQVILPEGARYHTASYSGDISMNGLIPSINYVFNNLSPVRVAGFTIDYEYFVIWAALRPTIWVGGIAALISVFKFRRKHREPASREISEKNVRFLTSFINISDQRIMLWSELDTLEESLDNRGIRRKDYNRRKRIIRQRLRAFDDALTGLKSEVRQIGPRYAELISRAERANAEILALRNNIERFTAQYRSGRIAKQNYKELKNNYRKKSESATRTLERIIIELKRMT